MRIALTLISILLNIATLAQKTDQKPNEISFEQKIQIADKLFKEGKTIEAIQSYNIARILAGTDNAKHTIVDKSIEAVFKAIEKQKEEAKQNERKARLAEAIAKESEQKAKIATNNANALYLTSEAEKINPIQGLRLTEKALTKTKDTNLIKTIKQANKTIFNQSNTHQWREKNRFDDIFSLGSDKIIAFSQNSKWFIAKDMNQNAKVWSLEQEKQADFLNKEKNIRSATFSPDSKWLVTEDVNLNAKVWSLEKEIQTDFFKERVFSATFSPDSKWLITEDMSLYDKVWLVEKGKQTDFLNEEKKIFSATFSPD
ncbi:WD40 repeat domain-containing protein, partial [Arcicella rosea]